ncbi:hypothetical protein HG531_011275 [Fusarium graminearum]|nr:hypothetical protein HG531_011275 [Fusarium graminearum]
MAADIVDKLLQESLGVGSNGGNLFEGVRRSIFESNDTVAVNDTTAVSRGQSHLRKLDRLVNKLDGLASAANGLEVTKGFANVVQGTAILGQSLDGLGTAGDKDGVEHAVSNDDSNSSRLDGRSLRDKVKLAQVLGLLSGIGLGVGRLLATNHLGNSVGKIAIDFTEAFRQTLVDDSFVTVVQLKGCSLLHADNLCSVIDVGTLAFCGRRLMTETVGPVVDLALGDGVSHGTITVKVHDRTDWLVDGELFPVGSQSAELSILVTSAESNLLGLGEVLIDCLVQLKLTNVSDGDEVLRPNLGGIEDIKVKVVLLRLVQNLDTKLPLGKSAVLDSLLKVLAVEVRVLTSKLEGLIPDK